jgi:ribonuclease J
MENTKQISVFPIYGYGNFGSNCTIIGDQTNSFIIDLGMSFTDKGEDYYNKVVKCYRSKKMKPSFVLLTHVHADHVSFILDPAFKKLNLPIYCSTFSSLFISHRAKGLDIRVLNPEEVVEIDGFKVKPLLIDHSCEETFAYEIEDKKGIKITFLPDHKLEDLSKVKKFTPKPNLLFIETTNSLKSERVDSESVVLSKIENQIELATNIYHNFFFSTFSLCTQRILLVADIAKRLNKKLLVLGKSLQITLKILANQGRIDSSSFISLKQVDNLRNYLAQEGGNVILCSGHQGEPNSALPSIIRNEIITPKDLVLFLSGQIPEPETIANRTALLSSLLSRKITYVDNVHCSGHSSAPELEYSLRLIDPDIVIPMHGDAKNIGGLADIITKKQLRCKTRIIVNGQFKKFNL